MVEIKVGMKAIIANSKNHAEYNFQMCEIKEIENAKRIYVELHNDGFITNFYVQANEIIPIVYENPEDLKKFGTTVDDIAKLFSEYKGYYDLICAVAEDFSHESDKKEKELEKIKEENFRNESIIEKFKNDFQIFDEKVKKLESDVEAKDRQIEEMRKYIDCLKTELAESQDNRFELPSEPIKAAEMLIYAKYSYKNKFTGMQHRGSLYSKSDLRQIAEHLLVYCNNSEDE